MFEQLAYFIPLCAQLKQVLTYFEQTTESNACNEDLAELHKMVSRIKMDEEVELEYMKIYEREEMIREEGIEQGQSEGTMIHLLRQVIKKITKGKSLEVIAEELEEDVADIASLYELVQKNPDKTAEELLPYVNASAPQP